jgi:hypothetical protein
MRPGAQNGGGNDRADTTVVQDVRAPRADDGEDRSFVLACFLGEGCGAAGEAAQHLGGFACGEIPSGIDAQPGTDLEHLRRGRVP